MALEDHANQQLPGGDNEQFAYGQDFRGVNPDMTALPQGVGGLGELGGAGEAKGADYDSMSGLDSYGAGHFNDGAHPADGGGMDAMQGLADGQQHPEVLRDEQVYATQEAYPFTFPEPESANPLNQPASGSQGDSVNTRE